MATVVEVRIGQGRLLDPVFLVSLVVPVAAIVLVGSPAAYVTVVVPVLTGMWRILLPIARQQARRDQMDIDLLFLLAHMYAVSTGRPARRRLFELNTLVGGYGEYQRVLRKIAVLAVEWGYGFVRATRLLASQVKNDAFRGFLIRASEVLRTGDDVVRFLRVELETAIRQFMSSYMRAIDLMRIFLGLYTTLMSASAFVILTFTILAVFVSGNSFIFVISIIALTATLAVFAFIARMIAPRDPIIYRSKEVFNPMLVRLARITKLAFIASLALGLITYLMTHDPMYTILAFALPSLAPGIVAMRVEGFVKRINMFYQVFVRSFGLTFSVIPNYANALASVLSADYGVLTPYLRRLHARITNGVDPHVAFRYFVLETMSTNVLRGTNIMVDSIDAGGDAAETGLMLSSLFIRLGDLRIDRDRVARTFEAVVYLMQGLVSAISSAVVNILLLFMEYYRQLTGISQAVPEVAQYFPFTITIPNMTLVSWAIAIFLAVLILINAVIIANVRGSMIEVALFHIAVLAIVTVAGVKAMEVISRMLVMPVLIPGPIG